MEGIRFIDIYATKGIEYLIVISFLAAFVLFCRYMYQPREGRAAARIAPENATRFRVPEGLFYHQGHGWLRPEPGSIGVVGLDDFAQKLIGKVDAVELPAVGSRLAQGEKGWSLVVDSEQHPDAVAGGRRGRRGEPRGSPVPRDPAPGSVRKGVAVEGEIHQGRVEHPESSLGEAGQGLDGKRPRSSSIRSTAKASARSSRTAVSRWMGSRGSWAATNGWIWRRRIC